MARLSRCAAALARRHRMKREYYFVTCDIVAHSAEPEVEIQKQRVIAINAIMDRLLAKWPQHGIAWASAGDGGHLAIPTEAPFDIVIEAIAQLRRWSSDAGVRLRVSAISGSAEFVAGAGGVPVLVGKGINLAGHVMPFASATRVVASTSLKDRAAQLGLTDCRFHDPRTVRLKHGNEHELYLLSLPGRFESTWTEPVPASDRALLALALERRDGLSAIYRARRLLELNRRDSKALAALSAFTSQKDHYAEAHRLIPDLFADDQVGPKILAAGAVVERKAGETLCELDDEGETMFWILRGRLAGFYKWNPAAPQTSKPDFNMRSGELAGELAFGLRRRRTATLLCAEETTVLAFHYGQILKVSPDTKLSEYIRIRLDRIITSRIFDYVWANAPWFKGLAADTARSVVLPYVKRTHLRLEDGTLKRGHDAFEPNSICILIGGSVLRVGESRLDGHQYPVLSAHLPGHDTPFATDYQLLEDVDLLTIPFAGILKLGQTASEEILARIQPHLPPRAEPSVPATTAKPNPQPATPRRLIILVHGIRTRAEWQDRLRPLFARIPETTVVPAGYGFFDVFRFLSPIGTRRAPIGIVEQKIRDTLHIHQGKFDEFIIVAHSFGTYIIGDILRRNPDICPDRLLLCGCILPDDFRWTTLPQDRRAVVLNEAGSRDIWPILAKSITWGYGATGTFGFKGPGVEDRFHNLAHSDYFKPGFAEQYWVPWLSGEPCKPTEYETSNRKPAPFYQNLIELVPLKWALPIAAIATLVLFKYFRQM